MAVYTEVSDEELCRVPRRLRHRRRCCPTRASPKASRTPTIYLHTDAGLLHPHALREAGERGRPAVLPRSHAASRRAGLNCPLPVHNRDGEALGRLAGRPAAIVTFLDGIAVRRPTRAALPRRSASALARLHLAGRDFPMTRAERACRSRAGRRFSQARRRGADRVAPGLAERDPAELDASCAELGRQTCRAASSTPTCSPTTCSSSATRSRA